MFGTRVEVITWGASEQEARTATAAVLQEFDRLHRAYHAWEPSELTALNDAIAAGRQGIPVSPELAAMLADAKQLAATGDELFNPALGQLIALWGFHTDTFTPHRPDPVRLAALVATRPQMADLSISGNTVTSRNPAVQLDLGGYGKGYALINNEFQRVISKLAFLPYGLILISHSQERDIETRTGKHTRIVPTLPEKARKLVTGLVDLILFCDLDMKTGEDGKPVWQRVMRTKPSPNYDAGDRTGRLPEVIPLDFSSFMKAFNNTAAGAAASAARPKPEPTASAAAKPQQ